MYKATIQKNTYSVDKDGDIYSIDGKPVNWDILAISDSKFHLVHNNNSYNAELVSISEDKKTVTLKINNEIFEVEA